ncbi:hypothetical protein ACRALDRAFT_1059950, partial [Sodiomyces alcalophilus JCM 7366]|uniref:uncharacterized protein n=1 Tax=Sodiomyces alcalophilus JCM 7366 TaxID=591952 RepID=UPI0039B637A5
MSHLNAKEFWAKAESGEITINSHDQVLRIAFIYLYEGLWGYGGFDHGVFGVVEGLHKYGWSFGEGDLKFNRTLDIFYLAQIAAGTYRWTDQLRSNNLLKEDDFDAFYARYHELLNKDAWKQYYSPEFLAQPISARFYRLPNLQDLPDSSDPLGGPRQKGIGHFTKLPRWAYNVARTHERQPGPLPLETIIEIALSTLQQTISRQRKDYPHIQPYSETQASYWLHAVMKIDDNDIPIGKYIWEHYRFGYLVAQGWYDLWEWEKDYSRERWENSYGVPTLKPDLDGSRPSEIWWCGLPDGGTGYMGWRRGWDPEVGGEEELPFLAAVAVKETENVDASMGNLDYAMRSHLLLDVLRAAFKTEIEREKHIDDLKRRMVEAGRLKEESKAEQWIREALKVMEPYRQDGWPVAVEDRGELLRQILEENGQLFARWKVWPSCKEFNFELGPRPELLGERKERKGLGKRR